MYLKETI